MTGQLRPALKRSKSDVTRTGVLDQTGEQAAQGGNTTGQLNAHGNADPEGEQNPVKEPTNIAASPNDTQMIPKPVPVSERQPVQQNTDNAEPTQRPALPPAVALATVLKVLEDEVNKLKSQLEINQKALKNHDASLGKKQRKVLVKNIESLLHEIDTKSDQIYSLYDVLEGQKEAGVEMTEDIEDITNAVLGGQNAKGKAKAATHDNDTDAVEIDEAESWGGFEETQELDQPSPRRKDQQRVSL
ncbi:hypothetical protein KEM55_009067 [Ascosphaera atra]|nr:hypothetical protein KEM55_009067 [Ascosphaera atra]